MNTATVMYCYRTGRPTQILCAIRVELGDVLIGNVTCPLARLVVQVIKGAIMTSGNNPHRCHVICYIIKVNANGQYLIIGVRPKLNILMPLNLFTTTSPFKVQL